MKAKNRIVSVGLAGAILMSLGGGAAMAADTPTGSTTPNTTDTRLDTGLSQKQIAERAARTALENQIRGERQALNAEKAKWLADIAQQRQASDQQRFNALRLNESERNQIVQETKTKFAALSAAKEDYQAKLRVIESKIGVSHKATFEGQRAILEQIKRYQAEAARLTAVAKTEDERRAITTRYDLLVSQEKAKYEALSKKQTETETALRQELATSLQKVTAANKSYSDYIQITAPKLFAESNAKLSRTINELSEQRGALEKRAYEGGKLWEKRFAEAEARWKAQRAALEERIRNGAYSEIPSTTPTPTTSTTTAK